MSQSATAQAAPQSVDSSPGERVASTAPESAQSSHPKLTAFESVARLCGFFVILVALIFLTNAMITSGLRRIRTSEVGALNQVMQGKVNAQIVITGSSRALAHFDPRLLEQATGYTAYNIGRNGSQTDMQVAFLRAYLEHNQKPKIVIHSLDAFSFVTSREVFEQVQYTPYLSDPALYSALWKVNPDIWKSRDLPLYGYVVEDMNFAWTQGVRGFFGWSPRQDFFLGFNPRSKEWSEDFERFRELRPHGVEFAIEKAGIQDVEDLITLCRQNGIQLIFVYSPEYREVQKITTNRDAIFSEFRELSAQYQVPFWDYSDWSHAGDRSYFQNSQHLNARGAEAFSNDLAGQLRSYISSSEARSDAGQSAARPTLPFAQKGSN